MQAHGYNYVVNATTDSDGKWSVDISETPAQKNDQIKISVNGKSTRTLSIPRKSKFNKDGLVVNPISVDDKTITGTAKSGDSIQITLPRTANAKDGTLEKEFQTKYGDFTTMIETQNESRGGSNGTEDDDEKSEGVSSEGISNPILKKAFEWAIAQVGKGITYSMGNRGGPTSYDCSGFVTSALKEAGFEKPYLASTVGMLEMSNALGQSGTVFKEVDYKTAKKGTIIVCGGLAGGGANGHTFFLLEDFKGPETKVLECSGSANGIDNTGTFQYASVDGEIVALEPVGDGSSSSSNSSSEKDDSDKGSDSKF